MNTIQRIIKNVSLLFISQMISYVFGFFALVYAARYLGVESFGILSLAIAFTGIFSVFMDMGLSTLTTRELARKKSDTETYISNITTIKLVLTLINLGLIFFIVQFLGYNQQTITVIYLILFYTIFNNFSIMFYAVFQANEKIEYQSLGVIISSILLLIGVLVAIYYKFDIIQFSSIYTVTGFFVLVYVSFSYLYKYPSPKLKFNAQKWKFLIKESWPFAITNMSTYIYTWIDTILLSILVGQEAVGLYNASYKLVLVLMFIPVVFNTAIFPIMSKYYISSKESLNITFEKLFKIMVIAAIPIGIGTVIIAKKLIVLIYGTEFIGAVLALQILIWSIVLIFARSPFERVLEASNQQLLVTKLFLIGVIFNIILNIIVIPKYSFIGAGIITVFTDALILGLILILIKNFGIKISTKIKKSLLKIVLASLVMGIVVYVFLDYNLFLLIIIGTIVYSAMLLILKILDNDEIAMIKSIIKIKKI